MIWAVTAIMLAAALLLLAAALFWSWSREGGAADPAELRRRVLGTDAPSAAIETRHLDSTEDPLLRLLSEQLWRAGINPERALLLRLLWASAAGACLALLLLGLVAGLTLVGISAVLAWLYLARRAARRRGELILQMPDFLEHVTRSLSAGNSLDQSIAEATADSPDPLQGLFSSVTRQIRLGAPVDEVLYEAAELHKLDDLRVMAMAARVNRRYGGSLRRIFRSLVQTIRERDAAGRELRALTAETRISAFVLAAVPVFIMVYILLQNPGYYQEMWNDSVGRILLLASLSFQVAGVAVIWRMLQAAEEQPL